MIVKKWIFSSASDSCKRIPCNRYAFFPLYIQVFLSLLTTNKTTSTIENTRKSTPVRGHHTRMNRPTNTLNRTHTHSTNHFRRGHDTYNDQTNVFTFFATCFSFCKVRPSTGNRMPSNIANSLSYSSLNAGLFSFFFPCRHRHSSSVDRFSTYEFMCTRRQTDIPLHRRRASLMNCLLIPGVKNFFINAEFRVSSC